MLGALDDAPDGAPAATVDNAPLRGSVAHRCNLRPHAHSLRRLKKSRTSQNDNKADG